MLPVLWAVFSGSRVIAESWKEQNRKFICTGNTNLWSSKPREFISRSWISHPLSPTNKDFCQISFYLPFMILVLFLLSLFYLLFYFRCSPSRDVHLRIEDTILLQNIHNTYRQNIFWEEFSLKLENNTIQNIQTEFLNKYKKK